jgi:hypothetical protein
VVFIRLKNIVDEVFQDYKKPSMMLATCKCDWKCAKEGNFDISVCQNSELTNQKNIEVSIEFIINRYFDNPITQAIVIGGLEPMLQFVEILEFIKEFRLKCDDDIVIYTGYYPKEILYIIDRLSIYKNIIIKFGRYKENSNMKFDDILGVWLSSDNQYAIKIS